MMQMDGSGVCIIRFLPKSSKYFKSIKLHLHRVLVTTRLRCCESRQIIRAIAPKEAAGRSDN